MAQLRARGAHFIGRFEGWRDQAYNDRTGNATVGFGHLIRMGQVTAQDKAEWGTITMQRGIQLLQHDAGVAITAIGHYIARPLSQCRSTRSRRSPTTAAAVPSPGRLVTRSTRTRTRPRPSSAVGSLGAHHSRPACTSGESVKRICSPLRRLRRRSAKPSKQRRPAFAEAEAAHPGSNAGARLGVALGRVEARATHSSRDVPATRNCATSRKRPPPSRRGRGNS